MGTIINYLKWRGDLTMLERPFNNVDNVILSTLIYVDFYNIRANIRCGNIMKLSEALNELLDRGYTSKSLMEVEPEFLIEISKSKRFGNINISEYRDIYDKNRNCQFAAIKFSLEDGTAYIAFRGTDKTIVGWRENFMMSFKETDAQLEAVTYINNVIEKENTGYRIGGHSKGGNLAVYSSAKCKTNNQNKILEIFNNDGPGFCKEIIGEDLLKGIKHRICRIVPEYSVIGMLFELDVPYQIVKSSEKGINQHDSFSWQVEGNMFIQCENINPQAKYLNNILNNWIEEEDIEHREVFVEQVFDAMESTGAKEIGEVTGGINSIEQVIIDIFYAGNKTKRVFRDLITTILNNFKTINVVELVHTHESLIGMIMITLGILLFVIPEGGFQIIGTGFVFSVFVFSIVRLGYHLKQKTRYKYKNVYVGLVYFLCVLLLALLAFHVSTLKLSVNFILGITIFFFGLIKYKKKLKNRIEKTNVKKLSWIQSAVSMVVGLAMLGIPYCYIEQYQFVIGLYFIVLGLTEIIHETCKSDERIK